MLNKEKNKLEIFERFAIDRNLKKYKKDSNSLAYPDGMVQ